MADQLLQGAKGDAGRDVEPSVIQCTDLIMLHCVTRLRVMVPDRQRVAACGKGGTAADPQEIQNTNNNKKRKTDASVMPTQTSQEHFITTFIYNNVFVSHKLCIHFVAS